MTQRPAPPENHYTIHALLAEGFSRSAIHYYRKAEILPPAHGRGRSAYYTDVHMNILRRIKRARDARQTLSDVREDAQSTYAKAFRA